MITTKRDGSIVCAVADAHQPIRRRQSFKACALSGTDYAGHDTGRLYEHFQAYRAYNDARSRGTIVYVVLSYATPIAWVLADGTTVVPEVRYSVTTTRHQTLARRALDHRPSWLVAA